MSEKKDPKKLEVTETAIGTGSADGLRGQIPVPETGQPDGHQEPAVAEGAVKESQDTAEDGGSAESTTGPKTPGKAPVDAEYVQRGEGKPNPVKEAIAKFKAASAEQKKTLYQRAGIVLASVVAVIAICAMLAINGGGGGPKMTAEMKAAAEARETLIVGVMDTGFPPFIYTAYDGSYTGTDYELMQKVCDEYGWELKVQPISWGMRNTMLSDGTVDCLWSGFNSYGREDTYAWTEPYLDESDAIVVKRGNKDIKTIEDLEDKTVAAVNGTHAYHALESVGMAMSRMGCADVDQCLEMLKSGEADAAVLPIAETQGLSGVMVLEDRLDYQTYAVACRPADTALRDLIGYALAKG